MRILSIKLICTSIICLFSIVGMCQDTTGYSKELYNAIVKDESPEEVKRILESGENVNARDEYKRTPLYIASYLHLSEIVQILIEKGANVEIPDLDGRTPLNISCFGDGYSSSAMRYNTVKELIENKADVNSKDKKGFTGLMRAAANGEYKIAELLIENGADVGPVSNVGESALSWAKRFNYVDLIELIEKNLIEEVVITKSGNVRKGFGTEFGIIGKVTDGQEFLVINKSGDWNKIALSDGSIGWINNSIVKEVIDLANYPVTQPEGFTPVSDLMNGFGLVSSGTYCVISNSDRSSTWILQLLSNSDILELSSSKNGIGDPSGSKIYFDSNGGHDLVLGSQKDENGNEIIPLGKNLIMFTHQNGAEYIRWKDDTASQLGPLPIKHLSRFIGIGSTVRFPSDTWVILGDKQYRNGGFTVLENSIKFISGTEVKTTAGIFKLNFYKWVKLGSSDN
jgi:hypothetical protein